ncbi:MAG: pyridoxine 5'-phosphate synthase [Porphyromonas sp.]|nr:pyridoxine 5'-phosphate synthase [Porphyromonas sp.]
MTKLSVNINKIATLRNARGENNPDVVEVAKDVQRFGANGITVHPRPDERHIRYRDVYDLRPVVETEFNIEGYPSEAFIDLVTDVKPEQVTLVPDAPDVITSNAGWRVREHFDFLRKILQHFKSHGIRTSIFIEPEVLDDIRASREVGADRVELRTGPYAIDYKKDREAAIKPLIKAERYAHEIGLGVNAGHDLDLDNLPFLSYHIPTIDEVSIGHALICDALYLGLEETVHRYLAALDVRSK